MAEIACLTPKNTPVLAQHRAVGIEILSPGAFVAREGLDI
jgi:hypothetical protein